MKKIRDVVFILDGSDSMHGKEKKVLEEYNKMIENYKKKDRGNFYITTAIFREECDLLQIHMPIKYAKKLDRFHYYSYGNTAYYDSVIEVVGLMEELVKERSSFIVSDVLVIIIGDEMDNASIRNSKDDLEIIFEKKKKTGWNFMKIKMRYLV